ncbi:MAG: 6,7-dimethyl-8-ribityllumazine synthase [Hyphomicrobiaceae bacterium]
MAGKASTAGGPTTKRIGAHILIIEGRFYADLADTMAAGAISVLESHGCTYERIGVPGALEIPQVLATAVEAGRFDDESGDHAKVFEGAIALGCVIRGETYHFEVVCNESNRWLMDIAVGFGAPVGNAILTVDTMAQAKERASAPDGGKGGDAARACLRLIEIRRQFVDSAA